MKISIDIIALQIIFSTVLLLWLPAAGLLTWSVWFIVILLLLFAALVTRLGCYLNISHYLNYATMLAVILAYMQYQALQPFQQANEIVAQNQTVDIRIDSVQHQQNYQTLIAQTLEQESRKVYVAWRAESQPRAGEIWRVDWRLRPLSARLNKGGFDRQQWYFAKGITATANVKSAVKIGEDFSWREQRLLRAFEQTKALSQQGLLLALSFGERAWLKPDVWQIYQQTNTAHLIAISGLHIGLAMLFGVVIARAIQIVIPTRFISPFFPILSGVGLALIYAELAGFAIPTFRALIALLLVYGIRFVRFYWTAWQLFIRVIALLLLYDPLMILSTSFWLSISAVACLILWYQLFPITLFCWNGRPCYQQLPYQIRWIFSLFHLQFGLFWLFTPIQLAVFGGFSWQGFWANLISVPFYSFVLVPITLFATLTDGLFHSWLLANLGAEWITQMISLFTNNWLSLNKNISLALTAFLTLILLLTVRYIYGSKVSVTPKTNLPNPMVSLQIKKPRYFSLNPPQMLPKIQRYYIYTLGWLVIGISILSLVKHNFYQPNWRIETLDVGQGLATLIVKNGRGVLYDTGASWHGGSMAETEILPYLQRNDIALDWLIISHDDNDHAGGAKAILQAFPQVKFISSSHKNYGESRHTFCQKGAQWEWQNLSFYVLSPDSPRERAENPDSCVLVVGDGKFNLLLTGDADIATEDKILPHLPKIDVLQVGHHGSKTSTGWRFVQQISPSIALISSGRWNPWHFPNKTVVERLKRVNSAVENTAISGQITLEIWHNKIKLLVARTPFSPWYSGFIGERSQ